MKCCGAIFFVLVTVIPVLSIALPETELHVDTAAGSLDASQFFHYRLTHDSIEQVIQAKTGWQKLRYPVVAERMRGDRLWLKLPLVNNENHSSRLVLVAGEARTDKVEFYLVAAGKVIASTIAGDLVLRETRPDFAAARFSFSLEARSRADVFVSVQNPVDLAADFVLMREAAFAEFGGRIYLWQGIFFGSVLVFLLFYGAIYFSNRSRTVSAYFWYLVFTGIFFAARTGLLYQLVGYRFPSAMNLVVAPLPGIIYAAGIRFARTFLGLNKASTADKILRFVQYVSLLPVPLVFFSPYWTRAACDWLALTLGPGLLVFAWLIRRQTPKAYWFLLGWCWPILASLMQYTGYDFSYAVRNVLLQAAVLTQFVFFAVFVGREISQIEADRARQKANLLMLQEDLEQARRVHEKLLPQSAPEFRGLEVRQIYRPMSALGGDYYDWISLGESRLALLVADVTGHGLPAALDAAVVHIAFQEAVAEAKDAASILGAMNRRLITQGVERCVSACCAIYDLSKKNCEVSLAGHPQAIVVAKGHPMAVGDFGPLLGFSPQGKYTSSVIDLGAGDRIYLCTDGAYEIPGSEADDHQVFAEVLAQMQALPLQAALQETLSHFEKLRKNDSIDDITLIGAEVVL